jgi:hypothetical protein
MDVIYPEIRVLEQVGNLDVDLERILVVEEVGIEQPVGHVQQCNTNEYARQACSQLVPPAPADARSTVPYPPRCDDSSSRRHGKRLRPYTAARVPTASVPRLNPPTGSHVLHHEEPAAHLTGVTVSMRVMSAGDGYGYLLASVAAGDGDRSLATQLVDY